MTQFHKNIEIAPNNRNRNLIWGVLLGLLRQCSEKDGFLKEPNWLRVATEFQLDWDSFSNALRIQIFSPNKYWRKTGDVQILSVVHSLYRKGNITSVWGQDHFGSVIIYLVNKTTTLQTLWPKMEPKCQYFSWLDHILNKQKDKIVTYWFICKTSKLPML